ncbi:DUF4337 domain-containing protein [Methylocella sp. CPCC 101449]|uniref:DUF4337 domain-containing protein n=1 Tax=Methylocella sp. CPCC 101449 TaxID=2987531 RepID=UPI00289087EF|nr:DUF4337 domain-containing protein [Methylocella sp. CPCC 101449]MDT2020535.1 DUF4337 domain-containing protein [Methylocella sp. CPCC 101449]
MSGHAHAPEGGNKGVALLIAILALMLAFAEMGVKYGEREAVAHNLEASNLWSFFQAKTVRRTTVQVAAEQMETQLPLATDPTVKANMEKRIADWKATAERYESEPSTGEGRKELVARAKHAEERRDHERARNELFEIASALVQIGIVLASAMIITGIGALAWAAGGLGGVSLIVMLFAMLKPEVLHLVLH